MKKVILAVVVIAACSGCTTARGEKIGTITKLSEQGVIMAFCTSWEGQIIRGGISGGTGAFGAPFDFTVPKEMVEKVRGYMEAGTEVKLHYYSYSPTWCSSDSGHFVTSIEPIGRTPVESPSGSVR